MRAAIIGISGPVLTAEETELLRACPPAGVILFGRNVQSPSQLSELVGALQAVLPRQAELMVDQEGGRVARLRPPHWPAHPPAAMIGACFLDNAVAGLRAAWLTGALIGLQCRDAGFTVAATPVLDLAIPGAHDVVGDRAYAAHPVAVARLGRAVANGVMAAGVTPVGKHAPGHGRAGVDSHLSLPVVDAGDLAADIRPFALNADLPWLMTAHIVYRAIDPMFPATLSATVIGSMIRGTIGFKGVLVSDDLAMHALSGTPAERALRALNAGCDLALYCSGDHQANRAILAAVPSIPDAVLSRLQAARRDVGAHRLRLDARDLAAERDGLLAGVSRGIPRA